VDYLTAWVSEEQTRKGTAKLGLVYGLSNAATFFETGPWHKWREARTQIHRIWYMEERSINDRMEKLFRAMHRQNVL
jgi:hypothetical protein